MGVNPLWLSRAESLSSGAKRLPASPMIPKTMTGTDNDALCPWITKTVAVLVGVQRNIGPIASRRGFGDPRGRILAGLDFARAPALQLLGVAARHCFPLRGDAVNILRKKTSFVLEVVQDLHQFSKRQIHLSL
jgi:hypothetical protein